MCSACKFYIDKMRKKQITVICLKSQSSNINKKYADGLYKGILLNKLIDIRLIM